MTDSRTTHDGKVKKRKGRPRPLPPHVTARNLAIEKRRREELNEDFVNLARLLPGLAHVRRLSKVSIVKESIRHLRQQRAICLAAARDMEEMLAENRRLVAEVNGLRSQVWGPTMPLAVPKAMSDAMTRLLSVKDEVYGTFPVGFGDNWAYNAGHGLSDGDGVNMGNGVDSSPDAQFDTHGQHHAQQYRISQQDPPDSDDFMALDLSRYEANNALESNSGGQSETISSTLLPDLISPDWLPTKESLPLDFLNHLPELAGAGNHSANYPLQYDTTIDLNSHLMSAICTRAGRYGNDSDWIV